ncbi:MAG: hypothetical protein AAGF07_01925 [Patescibacteria group bacterium]
MSFADDLQYKIENISLYFQGGVRRSVLIFAGICLVLLAPAYFIAQQISNLWFQAPFNPNRFRDNNIVIAKNISEKEVLIGETQVTNLINGENTLYLTINNKVNPEIGFFPYVYTVQILTDEDAVVTQKKYRSYLLPNEIKYIVATSPDPSGTKLNIIKEPETQPVNYNPNQTGISKQPNVVIKEQSVRNIPGTDKLEVRAVFKNEDQVYIDNIDVLYIIRDTRESVVGIGEYSFQGFLPNTERDITLQYPQPKDRLATQADIRWSVNYLDSSIIRLN